MSRLKVGAIVSGLAIHNDDETRDEEKYTCVCKG